MLTAVASESASQPSAEHDEVEALKGKIGDFFRRGGECWIFLDRVRKHEITPDGAAKLILAKIMAVDAGMGT